MMPSTPCIAWRWYPWTPCVDDKVFYRVHPDGPVLRGVVIQSDASFAAVHVEGIETVLVPHYKLWLDK